MVGTAGRTREETKIAASHMAIAAEEKAIVSRILVSIEMPEARTPPEKKSPTCTPEQRVRDAIELVESGYCSTREFLTLSKLYKALCARKEKSPRVQNIISMIKPVLAKYGYHGVSAEKQG